MLCVHLTVKRNQPAEPGDSVADSWSPLSQSGKQYRVWIERMGITSPRWARLQVRFAAQRRWFRRPCDGSAVEIEQGLLLFAASLLHPFQPDHLAHDLQVEADSFAFGIDLSDIVPE